MNDWLMNFVLHHAAASHSGVLVIGMILSRIDLIIKAILRVMPADKVKAALRWAEAQLEKQVDKEAAAPPAQPKP